MHVDFDTENIFHVDFVFHNVASETEDFFEDGEYNRMYIDNFIWHECVDGCWRTCINNCKPFSMEPNDCYGCTEDRRYVDYS